MAAKQVNYVYSKEEQLANIATSALSIPISILASALLYQKSTNPEQITTTFLYGSSLFLVFVSSALFHLHCYQLQWGHLRVNESSRKLNRILQIVDRTSILYCVASSCVPWLLLINYPDYVYGISIWTVYFIALLGFLFELTLAAEYPFVAILFYVAVAVFPALTIFTQFSAPGFIGVLVSGSTYIIGVKFFVSDGKIPFAHAIWHLFVLVASIIHYVNVYYCFYVL